MLPARYRMTRSTEFSATVSRGMRAVQPDLVVHALRTSDGADDGPKVGLVVAKSVGNAVDRHRVARRLRHVARNVLADLDPADRLVIRALPSSRTAVSARLEQQLRSAVQKVRSPGRDRR
ncbi:ribonuclease P protein component [Mycobacterium hubeiense]|uniref:ribonuclease P protein component n=1 Tax=Mycobacterium hubeiense TaxID=1867256 RepID=UPI000C7EDB96|nr:ribonuclease P protein component [Mycobacterium sp. QGD 101]